MDFQICANDQHLINSYCLLPSLHSQKSHEEAEDAVKEDEDVTSNSKSLDEMMAKVCVLFLGQSIPSS